VLRRRFVEEVAMDALWWVVLIAGAIVIVAVVLFVVRRARRAGTVLASGSPDRSKR
jgi:hypothetical protein